MEHTMTEKDRTVDPSARDKETTINPSMTETAPAKGSWAGDVLAEMERTEYNYFQYQNWPERRAEKEKSTGYSFYEFQSAKQDGPMPSLPLWLQPQLDDQIRHAFYVRKDHSVILKVREGSKHAEPFDGRTDILQVEGLSLTDACGDEYTRRFYELKKEQGEEFTGFTADDFAKYRETSLARWNEELARWTAANTSSIGDAAPSVAPSVAPSFEQLKSENAALKARLAAAGLDVAPPC